MFQTLYKNIANQFVLLTDKEIVLDLIDQINEYQVIQIAPDDILARIQVSDEHVYEQVAEVVRQQIERVFRDHGCHKPRIQIEFAPPVPNSRSSKLIRIHRAFEIDA